MAPVQSAQSGDFSNGAELGTPTARLDRFLSEVHPPTPFIVLDLDIVRARYAASRQALPAATIYYALKANPATELIAALAALGASFISPAPANSTFETKRRQGADPAASRQRIEDSRTRLTYINALASRRIEPAMVIPVGGTDHGSTSCDQRLWPDRPDGPARGA